MNLSAISSFRAKASTKKRAGTKKTSLSKGLTKKAFSKKKSAGTVSPKKASQNIQFHIENVRCFADKQTFEIRPLTFLTGENSTGKTTLLSCWSVLDQIIRQRRRWGALDFNKEPYNMGSFDDIIHKTGEGEKSNKKVQSFIMKLTLESSQTEYTICFKKKEKGSEPVIDYIKIKYKNDILSFHYNKKSELAFSLEHISKNKVSKTPLPMKITIPTLIPFPILLNVILHHVSTYSKNKISDSQKKQIKKIITVLESDIQSVFKYSLDFGPVRSKPLRTYDPIRENIDPEGKEIPMILRSISFHKETKWKNFCKKMSSFGQISGLFSDIKVEQYGKSDSGPFQLQFNVRGLLSNIADTGYGISQILPLLVHIFLTPKRFQFLIQQPEVHLHPKAQAELSTLLIQSIKDKEHSFLVETHSDYMVDRARIEIRKGNIQPDQVSLIYLEPVSKGKVKAHNLFFDKQGNIQNPPEKYRDFFLKETDRFLGFKD